MKANTWLAACALLFSTFGDQLSTAHAGTTMDPTDHHAYAANLGWVEWQGDVSHGAVIGEFVCSGFVYSANAGWINLGDGTPADLVQYQNNSATDFGVNHDGLGSLRGYAWGANIGWINFEATGAPKVNLLTGDLSGYVWSANCGWISLSNATAHVKTMSIAAAPDSDGDHMADAWEITYWAGLGHSGGLDTDHDGASDLDEYLAGTDPTDPDSVLRITNFQRGQYGEPTRIDMSWQSVPTRQYVVQRCDPLTPGGWADMGIAPMLGASIGAWLDTNDSRYYRVRAFRPLMD